MYLQSNYEVAAFAFNCKAALLFSALSFHPVSSPDHVWSPPPGITPIFQIIRLGGIV